MNKTKSKAKNGFHAIECNLRKLLRDEKTEAFKALINSINNFTVSRSSDPVLCLAVKKGNYGNY